MKILRLHIQAVSFSTITALAFAIPLMTGCSHSKKVTEKESAIAALPDPNDHNECHSVIDSQIRSKLTVATSKGTPEKIGFFTITFPANETEYGAMNKTSLLVISVFSKKKETLPINKISFIPASNEFKGKGVVQLLPRVFPLDYVVDQTEPPKAPSEYQAKINQEFLPLGRFRQDLYLLLPMRLLKESGSLVATINSEKDRLELGQFPLGGLDSMPFFVEDKKPTENPEIIPSPELVVGWSKQYYCLFQ